MSEEVLNNDVINLDANANAPATRSVIDAVTHALLGGAGNPSSAHLAGDLARDILTRARNAVAALVEGAYPENVIFTSGCTEANNTIITGMSKGGNIVSDIVEHPSVSRVLDRLDGNHRIVRVTVDASGAVDLKEIDRILGEMPSGTLLSVQSANSETGVMQPLERVAEIAIRHKAIFHSDVAQSFGKATIRIGSGLGPDVITLSGHKIHAPAGIGAIIVREGLEMFNPLLTGGAQERGVRAGTEAISLIAGLAAACEDRLENFEHDTRTMAHLRDRLEGAIVAQLPWVVVNGSTSPRMPNVTNLMFTGVDGMALIANLDAQGVLASQGSACSSMRPEPSPVLVAMGVAETEAYSSVRFSTTPLNTEHEIDCAVKIIVSTAKRLKEVL